MSLISGCIVELDFDMTTMHGFDDECGPEGPGPGLFLRFECHPILAVYTQTIRMGLE